MNKAPPKGGDVGSKAHGCRCFRHFNCTGSAGYWLSFKRFLKDLAIISLEPEVFQLLLHTIPNYLIGHINCVLSTAFIQRAGFH